MSSAPPALLRRLCRDVGFDSNHTRFLPARDPEAWRVFADGLLDKGDVRGRLIHARLDAEMAPGRRPAYEQLRRELAAAHRETWLANLPEGVGAILRDGFVVGWWTYDEPHFTRWLEAWPAFQAHPDGALCSSWRHEGDLADETLQQLTQGSELAGLRRLHLWENELASAQTLAEATTLPDLIELVLDFIDIGDAGAMALAESPALRGLTSLTLRVAGLTDLGAQAVSCFERLESLNLECNFIGDDGARALAESTGLAKLVELTMTENSLSAEGEAILRARWPWVRT